MLPGLSSTVQESGRRPARLPKRLMPVLVDKNSHRWVQYLNSGSGPFRSSCEVGPKRVTSPMLHTRQRTEMLVQQEREPLGRGGDYEYLTMFEEFLSAAV